MMDGDPGEGKSFIATNYASRLSTGEAMPFETRAFEPMHTLYITTEDDPHNTIWYRLEDQDADRDYVHVRTHLPNNHPIWLPDHLDWIRADLLATGSRFLIIDPIMAHLSPKHNSNQDQSVRLALTPLRLLAQDLKVAVVLVRHLSKAERQNILYKGAGSVGIVGFCRFGVLIVPDSKDSTGKGKVMHGFKHSMAPQPPTLRYHIEGWEEEYEDQIVYRGKLVWDAEVTPYVNHELVAPPRKPDPLLAEACAFLQKILANGPVLVKHVKAAASARMISAKTLREAREQLGIHDIDPEKFGGDHSWKLPPSKDQ
jgi:hypothetical protein